MPDTARPLPDETGLSVAETERPRDPSNLIAPDCRGENFWQLDRGLRDLLSLYLTPEELEHFAPQWDRLGELAGGRLDELADQADKHPPVLHPRDRFGRDVDHIEYHPAYREMERIAFGDLGLHVMSHQGGVNGWPEPVRPLVKYVFQYLFVQAEFGLMCPISVTDTSTFLVRRYGDEAVKSRVLDRMLSRDMDYLWKGTQFMTEKPGGSDVSMSELEAVEQPDGTWRLYGEKWFCSHTDGDVALLLARPRGAPEGSRGLALFAMPRILDDGSRNTYRIVRLKEKLGTKSMASGEIVFEGAVAYLLGDRDRGLKQMMDQVVLSRLSHGVRAAAMMRRCLNEAMAVARHRRAFGRRVIEHPLMRRQLAKIMVSTEQALSMFAHIAATMADADAGDALAAKRLRILSGLFKLRACRDNVPVATAAMETRGGNGYIEDWVNPRLVRDAHIGLLWEGTSNINGLDVIQRATARERAHEALGADLDDLLRGAEGLPGQFRSRLATMVARAVERAGTVAVDPAREAESRVASTALYDVTSAALLAREGAELGSRGGDARRLLLARLVVDHRLASRDPLAPETEAPDGGEIVDHLLDDAPVPLKEAVRLVG